MQSALAACAASFVAIAADGAVGAGIVEDGQLDALVVLALDGVARRLHREEVQHRCVGAEADRAAPALRLVRDPVAGGDGGLRKKSLR